MAIDGPLEELLADPSQLTDKQRSLAQAKLEQARTLPKNLGEKFAALLGVKEKDEKEEQPKNLGDRLVAFWGGKAKKEPDSGIRQT